MFNHALTKRKSGIEINTVICKRNLNRLTNSLFPGEVNDGVNFVFIKDFVQCCLITYISFIEGKNKCPADSDESGPGVFCGFHQTCL